MSLVHNVGALMMCLGLWMSIPCLHSFLVLPLIVLTLLTVAWLMVPFYGCQRNSAKRAKEFFNGFCVGGHRGSPLSAPENTMESFQEAVNAKMDLVEFDLALSKDGEVVIMHDDDLLRTCGVEGNVSSFTLEELKIMNAGYLFYKDKKSLSDTNSEGSCYVLPR